MAKMTIESAPKKKEKRKVSSVHIERGANGGYIVNHRMEPPKSPGASMMGAIGEAQPPMPFSGKKAHKQASGHVAQLMSQMHDMPEMDNETEQATPTGAPGV